MYRSSGHKLSLSLEFAPDISLPQLGMHWGLAVSKGSNNTGIRQIFAECEETYHRKAY